jgi:hypothetical protein
MITVSPREKMRLLFTFYMALLVGFHSSAGMAATILAQEDERLYTCTACCLAAVLVTGTLWGLVARKWP